MNTDQIAVYHLTGSRSGQVVKDLPGEDFNDVLVSDRYSACDWIDPAQRQACWSHLSRDFQALIDRGAGRPGSSGAHRRDPHRSRRPVHRTSAEGPRDLPTARPQPPRLPARRDHRSPPRPTRTITAALRTPTPKIGTRPDGAFRPRPSARGSADHACSLHTPDARCP
jgi:hypothetical protein